MFVVYIATVYRHFVYSVTYDISISILFLCRG